MKILHYVDENNLAWGETWIQLLKKLSDLGIKNNVVCRGGGTLAERLREENIPFDTCKPYVQSLPLTNMVLGNIIDRTSPDAIHTRLSSAARIGGWWGKVRGIPVIQTIDKYAKYKYYKNGTFYFACSRSVAEYLTAQGISETKIAVVHNPIDVTKYALAENTRSEMRRANSVPDNCNVILSAGRFVDWKGFDILIKGYARFLCGEKGLALDTVLWIVGDGEERARLFELVKVNGLENKVKIFPFAKDIRPYMQAADLFVLPSKEPEPFGIVLLEAMASSLPVIATKAGGPLDMLKDGKNGWFVEAGDEFSISQRLTEVLSNKEALIVVAHNAQMRAHDFSVESIGCQTIELYRNVIRSNKYK
ncbi:MAG: glycosyltransferase family 4 protein [Cloacibacillus porcorum]|uniref:glycosyltransferase family 4 protein n=1 Tax=Cloacibacillus porcorum TaxID=1197717 RepID=UPI002353CB23|nr:glycosyltransferase family 4 protein [Cloacibacillus porcorum]MCC8184470.1 glycosyltransferase family 4 protein [Cloacibacillus porcorum]MCI5864224.1 glycosyltransferase family 4 protein [Cloacibacillus porcorum]MDD7648602.1 glycosyltransferase family 4 protein [Cloacibacillus porcorum]MDY4092992.1 glycosyltransferase family 4 protein [Cloacibacillus porcorum]